VTAHWIRFRQNPIVLCRKVDDEVIVALPYTISMHGLEGPAGTIWQLLGSPVSLPELVSSLANTYGVDANEIEGDVKRTLDDLMGRHLVEEIVGIDG